MKKLLILVTIALIAAPAFAGGILAQTQIPVMMVIDKTVNLTVDPPEILLTIGDPNLGNPLYRGYTGVTMTHNFPVTVTALINSFGPSLGAAATYHVALADFPINLPQTYVGWQAAGNTDDMDFTTPAPPAGRLFYVGAAVANVDIGFIPSSPAAQQVATVLLTVSDNL